MKYKFEKQEMTRYSLFQYMFSLTFPSYSYAYFRRGSFLFEVRVINLSRLNGIRCRKISMELAAIY